MRPGQQQELQTELARQQALQMKPGQQQGLRTELARQQGAVRRQQLVSDYRR